MIYGRKQQLADVDPNIENTFSATRLALGYFLIGLPFQNSMANNPVYEDRAIPTPSLLH